MGLFNRKPKVKHWVAPTQKASDNLVLNNFEREAREKLKAQGKSDKEINAWLKQCLAVSKPDDKEALS